MLSLLVTLGLSIPSLADGEVYGLSLSTTLDDKTFTRYPNGMVKSVNGKKTYSESDISDRYEKKLQNDFFNRLDVITDKNKKIYQIKLVKSTFDKYDVYTGGNKVLDKLKQKHGTFKCKVDSNPLFGKLGDTCINNSNNKFEVKMGTWTWGKEPSLSVTYTSREYIKLISEKDDLSKL